MINFLRITLIMSLLSYIFVCCSNPFNPFDQQNSEFTPEDEAEAELIALCLSGDLVASDELYHRVLRNLASIRSTFGGKFEPINLIRFTAPWVAGCLIVGFDDKTAEKVASGEYNAWDELNKSYQVTKIDTNIINATVLYFKDRLHPRRLSELYRDLPGVRYTEPNHLCGDFSNIYPKETQQGITYLFRKGWGDCPAGCIYNEYWYFIVYEWKHTIFIGHWIPNQSLGEPYWWNEARLNIVQFHNW